MKNIGSTLLLIACITTTANAQFGFEAGLNLANLSLKSGGTSVGTKFKPGVGLGMVAGFRLDEGQHVYFEPGLFYLMNGAVTTGQPTGKYYINTINIPLNIEYRWGERCGARFFVGAGPYIADNLSGNYNTESYGLIPSTTTTLTFAPANGYEFKQWEFGAGVNVGYIGKKHLYIRAHYQMGFNNLLAAGDANNSFKQSSLGITIGYLFRGCNRANGGGGRGGRGGDHWRGLKKNKWSRKQFWRRPNGPGF